MLRVGERAPSFSGTDQNGRLVRSEELLSKGPVILYFYPRDFTPGCTAEACYFRDAFEELTGLGAEIVGVSIDDESSHKRFATTHALPFSLLSDATRQLAKSFGIVRPLGLGARRVTFVIDGQGVIRGAFHHELAMAKHVENVRQLLATMKDDRRAADPA